MNYRHAYHAGNFVDIIKHMILLYSIDYMKKKTTPFYVLDTHAGKGVYDLNGPEAQKTQEALSGVLALDFEVLRKTKIGALYDESLQKYLAKGMYPGSPALIIDSIRNIDRLQMSELHPEDYHSLKSIVNNKTKSIYRNMGIEINSQVYLQDAYQSLKAFLPPKERRGIILIDPPFEKKDEFAILSTSVAKAIDRFANGVYIIWYPIKEWHGPKMLQESLKLHNKPLLEIIHSVNKPSTEGGLKKSGISVINPPYMLEENIREVMGILEENKKDTGSFSIKTVS